MADAPLLPPISRARRHWNGVREVVIPLLACLGLLLAWELCVDLLAIPDFLLPAPSQVVAAAIESGGRLALHGLATLETILGGFFLSIAISFPIAIAIAYSRLFSNAAYPLLVASQSIPVGAMAPILVTGLGTGALTRLTVRFLIAFFPVVINTSAGLLATPPELIDLARVLRLDRRRELYLIRLPHATPQIFAGLKVSITLSVIGAVVAEFSAADQGLGYLIIQSSAFFKVATSFAAVSVLAVIGIVLFQTIVFIERRCFAWAATVKLP